MRFHTNNQSHSTAVRQSTDPNHPRGTFRKWSIVTSLLVLFTSIPAHSESIITAASGLPAVKGKPVNTGSGGWESTGVTAKDSISWTSGINTADFKDFAKTSYGPTPYFTFTPGSTVPAGGPLTGFSRIDIGPQLTEVITAGFGASAVNKGVASATYSVLALGFPLNPPNFQHNATASAIDPWAYSALDFANLDPLQNVDLFFPSAIVSGSLGPLGSLDFHVDWTTAAGTLQLLNILMVSSALTITQDFVPGLQIYQLSPGNMTPTGIIGPPLSLSDIRNLVASSLGSGGSLQAPISLGFMVNNVPFPTATLTDGSLGNFGASITAQDQGIRSGNTPEPGTWVLIGAGLLCLSQVSRKHRPA